MEFEDEVVPREGEIELHEGGDIFTVVGGRQYPTTMREVEQEAQNLRQHREDADRRLEDIDRRLKASTTGPTKLSKRTTFAIAGTGSDLTVYGPNGPITKDEMKIPTSAIGFIRVVEWCLNQDVGEGNIPVVVFVSTALEANGIDPKEFYEFTKKYKPEQFQTISPQAVKKRKDVEKKKIVDLIHSKKSAIAWVDKEDAETWVATLFMPNSKDLMEMRHESKDNLVQALEEMREEWGKLLRIVDGTLGLSEAFDAAAVAGVH